MNESTYKEAKGSCWINGNTVFTILTVIVFYYIFKWALCGDDDAFYNKVLHQGLLYLDVKNYDDALYCFQTCIKISKDQEEIRQCKEWIGLVYLEKKEYDESIEYFSEAIEGNERSSSISYYRRSTCYIKKVELKKALEDASLAYEFRDRSNDKLEKTLRERKNEALEMYAYSSSTKYRFNHSLHYSNLRCSDLYKTFVGIIPDEDKENGYIAYFLQNKDYDALYTNLLGQKMWFVKKKFEEYYGSDTLFTFDLIMSSIYFLFDHINQCPIILSSPKNDLEYVFFTFVESIENDYEPKPDLLERLKSIEKSTNPTVKFWLAKAYQILGYDEKFLEIMNSLKDEYSFAKIEIIEHYIQTKDLRKFRDLERETLQKSEFDYDVIFNFWDFYYRENYCNSYMERLKMLNEIMTTDNARSLYMKAMYHDLINETDLRDKYLNDAIEMDDTYFDIYFYLAEINKSKNTLKYKYYFDKAFKTASCFAQLFKCFKEKLNYENQEYVKKKLEIII